MTPDDAFPPAPDEHLPEDTPEPPQGSRQARSWFDQLPVAAFVLSADGVIRATNRLGTTLFGLGPGALVGHRLTSLLAPTSRSAFTTVLERSFEAPTAQRAEVQQLVAGDVFRDLLLDLMCLEQAEGSPGCLVTATDITAFKAAHRHLLDLSEAQTLTLRERDARIRMLNEELEHVITTLIEQLRLPVGRALDSVDRWRAALEPLEPLPQAAAQPVADVELGLQQVFALFKSVERYMQARRLRARLRSVDLNAVFRDVLRDVQPLLKDRDVRITHDALPVLQGDSQALTQILIEYVSNALKFTRAREPGRIRLRVRVMDSEVLLGVEDNGVGFNMRQQGRLFRMFQRQHDSSEYEGSGIGLAVVRRVAGRFGARVWAEGKVDQGATFWLAWPKHPTLLE